MDKLRVLPFVFVTSKKILAPLSSVMLTSRYFPLKVMIRSCEQRIVPMQMLVKKHMHMRRKLVGMVKSRRGIIGQIYSLGGAMESFRQLGAKGFKPFDSNYICTLKSLVLQ